MIIKLNNQEIVCQSYEKTDTTLKLIGVEIEDGLTDMTLKGVNWSAIEFLDPLPYIPSEHERIEALEDVVNLIIAGEL